jgi:hypothetical protein
MQRSYSVSCANFLLRWPHVLGLSQWSEPPLPFVMDTLATQMLDRLFAFRQPMKFIPEYGVASAGGLFRNLIFCFNLAMTRLGQPQWITLRPQIQAMTVVQLFVQVWTTSFMIGS